MDPVLGAALFGAFHGLNPAMGWLFAVFLGLQRKSQRVVLLALAPIACGHAASVLAVAALVVLARSTLPVGPVRVATAALLLAFGAYKLLTLSRHPRWVGLNVGYRDLAWWSFLMATAHGSGLMLTPLLLGVANSEGTLTLLAVHSASMVVVMAVVAVAVFHRLGVVALRRYWINFDVLWVGALLLAGVLALGGLFLAPAH